MKKRPAKNPRPTLAPPNCDGSPPYPPTPPATGTIPGDEVIDFIFFGARDTAKSFNEGQLVQHTMLLEDGEATYVFSLRGGPHKRRTLSKLDVKALLGPCKLVIQDGPSTVLPTNGTAIIPAGATFSLEAADEAVIHARSVTGPGLAKPTGGGGDFP